MTIVIFETVKECDMWHSAKTYNCHICQMVALFTFWVLFRTFFRVPLILKHPISKRDHPLARNIFTHIPDKFTYMSIQHDSRGHVMLMWPRLWFIWTCLFQDLIFKPDIFWPGTNLVVFWFSIFNIIPFVNIWHFSNP